MNNLSKMFSESTTSLQYADKYYTYLSHCLTEVNKKPISELIEAILECRKNNRFVFLIGNGGSAATATHFANDLLIGPRFTAQGIKALSLCDNQSIITAVGNDMGYEEIFTKQLENLASKDDLLIAISASGNSPNIMHSIKYAKEKGLKIAGLSGFDGGALRTSSDIKIHLETPKGEYAPVEDFHMTIVHLIGSYIRQMVMKESL
ncbi:MAG: SIS domain-containing protein [Bacteriovorax sp.]|nr:SIS domain-containing protein [Bacteriovorax sp.]